jgi:phosphoribosylanthranilate isomerase
MSDGIRPKVKICGITTVEAMDAALEGGADYVGLVFFPPSPRNLDWTRAASLATRARGTSQIVALVVDANDDFLGSIIEHVSPDVIQLHGNEKPLRAREILTTYRRRVWKALPVATADDAERALEYMPDADILFDAKAPKGSVLPGGNGHAFDWRLLDGVKGRFPYMLSGGLNPDNVADAIAATSPWGVDVSSGVETAPGVKDPALIRRFLAAVGRSSRGHT